MRAARRGQDDSVTTSAAADSNATGRNTIRDRARTGQDEVVDLCRHLLRIPSVNRGPGDGDERQAAEYVAEKLEEVGLETTIVESEKNRTSVIARVEGEDRSRGGLLIHGHLDVVPADTEDWTLPPFSGEIDDGCLWGRGAVDMKDMDAM